ncbi:MAG: sigma-70 family RNA polymerase sigma factor [Hyphomicrobium sp.]|uniref:sigma-70 family RNA polymerase sigma factor n=1 Tax=Hyphomicrobium sp. TaxID=82 RepID=UPI0039E4639A
MTEGKSFGDALIETIPNLRAFAHSLSGDSQLSNDLVQETLLKAWAHKDSFVPDSNLKAWLFTILRNTYFTHYRRSQREDLDEDHAAMNASVPPPQLAQLEFEDMQRALMRLTPDHREALLLITAEGFSYEDAARVCGCAVGTMKSRVNRARSRLLEEMTGEVTEASPGNDQGSVKSSSGS